MIIDRARSITMLERLKWALMVRECRGCDRCDYHTHDLTWLGKARYALWIAIDR